jgi:hypothetical protein
MAQNRMPVNDKLGKLWKHATVWPIIKQIEGIQ